MPPLQGAFVIRRDGIDPARLQLVQSSINRREIRASEPEVPPAVSECTITFAVRSTDLRRP